MFKLKLFFNFKHDFRLQFILISLLVVNFKTFATQNCENYLSPEYVLFNHQNSISFSDVEVYRKNNNLGPQQNGLIKFKSWFELTFEFVNTDEVASIIGLTENGRIYHLIKFNDRTIARLLSGHKIFKLLEVSNKGRILAIDENENFYFYSSQLWNLPLKKIILKKWFKLWGLTSFGAISATTLFLNDYAFTTEIFGFGVELPILEVLFSSVAAMSSGFAMLSKYEDMNTYPDGFVLLSGDFNFTNWTARSDLPNINNSNLNDFEPPSEQILEPKLNQSLTEDIR